MGRKEISIQEDEIEKKVKYGKIIVLSPYFLFLKIIYNIVIVVLGLINNMTILLKGKQNKIIKQKIIRFVQFDYFLAQIMFFRTNRSFSEKESVIIENENNDIIEESMKRIFILERLGGLVIFFQTRIIYFIFLFVNWFIFLIIKLFRLNSSKIESFIESSISEIKETNFYLSGIKDDRIKWNSLDDPIAGVFYPLLTHGFLFGYFLLYAYLAILRLSDNPLYLIDGFFSWSIGELIHSIIIMLFLYLGFFLFLIPYYIRYPEKISQKKITQIWKDLGFTIRYPLRDILVLVFFTFIFLILYYGTLQELIQTKTIIFNLSSLKGYLIAGIFWSIAEEITFRGYVIRGLQRKTNSLVAITVSSIIFGVYHILQAFSSSFWGIWWVMINALIIGILLAVFRVKSKSIFGPFIIHLFDYILFKSTFYQYQKIIPISNHNIYDLVLMLIICILTIGFILLVYPWKKREKDIVNKNQDING